MKQLLFAMSIALPIAALAGCAGDYGYRESYAGTYSSGPIAYDGFYDDYYGPIHDGYWGNDDFFYYRRGSNDRRFHRGGSEHFSRGVHPGGRFHQFRGTMMPGRHMHMPHFHSGGRRASHGHGRH